MIAVLRVELRKLGGSLALILALVTPALLGLLALLGVVSGTRPPAWPSVFGSFILPVWAFFLLPMAVTAFTTLVAQIEYKGRGWDHLLALPIDRRAIFAAKALVVFVAVAAMTALVVAFTLVGTQVGGMLSGRAPVGAVPWATLGRLSAAIVAGSSLYIALQLWVALRFASFVVPLAFGIGGTLIAISVAMTRTTRADWFPWVLPVKVVTGPHPWGYALPGAIAAVVVVALMVLDLSRRPLR